MKILIINCGSSSIKYRVFAAESAGVPENLAGGTVSGLGQSGAMLEHEFQGRSLAWKLDRPNHRQGLASIMEVLLHPEHGPLKDLSEVRLVGHRTVHGGEGFNSAVVIGQEVIAKIERCIPLAPIHNPANLEGIRQAQALLPKATHVAVFDTAFHQTLPARAFVYALPYELYQQHGIRRFGFHGTSCRYVSQRAAELNGQPLKKSRMVICHLGNGVTVAAVQNGCSIDTSLGFTPLEGAMMGTRCGDLDPGVLLYLQREMGMSHEQVDEMLNRQSGLLGVSGRSNDMRELIQAADDGDRQCALAVEMFAYRLKKYIGAYAAAMGGIDTLIFTGGIGENSPRIRELVLKGLGFMDIELDPQLNADPGQEDRIISRQGARVAVAVVRTKEELMIAREALALVRNDVHCAALCAAG